MFITFEGADGCGKTTQVQLAYDYLTTKGFKVIKTRDPGGTDLGLHFRDILLNYHGNICSITEMFIFLADRAQHVEHKILPAIKDGVIVLCDRYIDSTTAYQGYGRGIPIDEVEYLNKIATQNLLPDLTILLDISTEIAMQRVSDSGSKDRLESEQIDFHNRVTSGYRKLAQKHYKRFYTVNANLSLQEVSQQVINAINSKITQINP